MGEDSTATESELSTLYPKTCLICFGTDKSAKKLFELWIVDSEEITLLDKLELLSKEKLWVNEFTLLCENCLKDVNNAFRFQRRLVSSQSVWKSASASYKTTDNSKNETSQISDESIPIIDIFDHEISTKNLKADELAEDSLTYYSCKNCDALFTNSEEFNAHKCQIVVNTSKPTPSYSEDELVNLVSQAKKTSKSRVKNLDFRCDLCGKQFKNLNTKNGHKVKVHFQERVFPCNFCNKSFKQKYHLKEHLTSHTGEKNYSCSICNKIFQRISSQRRHMKTHQRTPGEKMKQTPFLCMICGKSFPYSNGVQRHLRIHTGEKKYECNICKKKFSQSTHLIVHFRIHTGEKPYMCSYCGDSFALNAALQKHIITTHNADHN